uniref:DNA-directed RNA polymerase I subunit RPA49 n=1 Tax=Glossina brevipalpis TaxID=37001 RepID=A0A1A9W3X3_9MUSC
MKDKVKIEKIFTAKKDDLLPTLITFQNGELLAFNKSETEFWRLKRQGNNSSAALLALNGQTYHGLINSGEASDLTDTYVCIRKKAKNMLVITPVDYASLSNNVMTQMDDASSRLESLPEDTLLKKFGGRKAMRYISDKEKTRVNLNLVQEDLQAQVEAGPSTNEESSADNITYYDSIRPPFNAQANTVSEVYKLNDIVPQDLLDRLEEEARTIYQTKIDEIPIKCEYLLTKINDLQKTALNAEIILKIKMVLYMDCLFNLITSKARSLIKTELSEISEKVENVVRERFADPNRYSGCRSSFSTEKALCHFIVLALLLDSNYQIDALMLSQELKTPRAKIIRYAHLVQATPKPRSSILTLRLPKLVPPINSKVAKKRKSINKH